VKDEVYLPQVSVTLKNLKNRIRRNTAKTVQPLLQDVWREVEYRLDVCVAVSGAYIKLAQGVKKLFEFLFTMMCVLFL
jgi:hypothetical protein